jgi:MATE family multidrug resistance protein
MNGELEETQFESGSPREVASVAWPIVISMLAYTAMGVFDTMYVGWLGKTELAAVGIATTAFFLINALFLGSLRGVKVMSAQSTGADEGADAVSAGWVGAAIGIPFGLLVVAMSFFDGTIFAILGGTDAVQSIGRDYFNIRVWGAIVWYVTIAVGNYFQGTGDTRTPMKINLVANALNVVVDPLLIFGIGPFPEMGVEGAALATIIAQGTGMVVAAFYFIRQVGWTPEFDTRVARKILRLGLPMGIQQALNVAGFAAFTALLARMGEAQLAAHQVTIKIISVSFLPGYGISEATSILTGQYVGADDVPAARRSFRSAMGLGVGLMGLCGLVFFLWPGPLIRVFNTHPDVVSIGADLLLVAAVFQVFDAVAMVSAGALNGTGDTKFTMWASITGKWLVLVPSAYLFGYVLDWGAAGAWLGLTAEILAVAVVNLGRFAGDRWTNKGVV